MTSPPTAPDGRASARAHRRRRGRPCRAPTDVKEITVFQSTPARAHPAKRQDFLMTPIESLGRHGAFPARRANIAPGSGVSWGRDERRRGRTARRPAADRRKWVRLPPASLLRRAVGLVGPTARTPRGPRSAVRVPRGGSETWARPPSGGSSTGRASDLGSECRRFDSCPRERAARPVQHRGVKRLVYGSPRGAAGRSVGPRRRREARRGRRRGSP